MARIKLRYVQEFVDRWGVTRRYFRRTGFPRIPLPGAPGSKTFMAAYQAALTKSEPAPEPPAAPDRSVGALIDLYYRSAVFTRLRSQRPERNIMERIRKQFGNRPADTLPRAAIVVLIDDMADRPAAANNFLAGFRKLMKLAVRLEWRKDDPTIGVDKVRYQKTPFTTWSDEDIARFKAKHPAGSRARLALALLLNTGQRRSDVVTMGWSSVIGPRIAVKQMKTGAEIQIPIHPDLTEELRLVPRDQATFLTTRWGKPFTAPSFGNWFRDVCNEAGLPELSAHGLRHAQATRLADIGCTPHQIKAITGHKTLAQVQNYTARVDQIRLADEAIKRLIVSQGAEPKE